MSNSIFISGIGTGIGKTIASAIICRVLQADYWKPVQAGTSEMTDSEWVLSMINPPCKVFPEVYKLTLAASPHIAARHESLGITIERIMQNVPDSANVVIEGAGGLFAPLNANQFVIDLIKAMGSKVVLVSRNYLGSINHSLMTAQICKQENLPVAGWIFNDQYMDYEAEIVEWTSFPKLASIPYCNNITRDFISTQAGIWKNNLLTHLC